MKERLRMRPVLRCFASLWAVIVAANASNDGLSRYGSLAKTLEFEGEPDVLVERKFLLPTDEASSQDDNHHNAPSFGLDDGETEEDEFTFSDVEEFDSDVIANLARAMQLSLEDTDDTVAKEEAELGSVADHIFEQRTASGNSRSTVVSLKRLEEIRRVKEALFTKSSQESLSLANDAMRSAVDRIKSFQLANRKSTEEKFAAQPEELYVQSMRRQIQHNLEVIISDVGSYFTDLQVQLPQQAEDYALSLTLFAVRHTPGFITISFIVALVYATVKALIATANVLADRQNLTDIAILFVLLYAVLVLIPSSISCLLLLASILFLLLSIVGRILQQWISGGRQRVILDNTPYKLSRQNEKALKFTEIVEKQIPPAKIQTAEVAGTLTNGEQEPGEEMEPVDVSHEDGSIKTDRFKETFIDPDSRMLQEGREVPKASKEEEPLDKQMSVKQAGVLHEVHDGPKALTSQDTKKTILASMEVAQGSPKNVEQKSVAPLGETMVLQLLERESSGERGSAQIRSSSSSLAEGEEEPSPSLLGSTAFTQSEDADFSIDHDGEKEHTEEEAIENNLLK